MYSKLLCLAAIIGHAAAQSPVLRTECRNIAGSSIPECLDVTFDLPNGATAAFERDATQEMNLEENVAAANANAANSAALVATLSTLTETAEDMETAIAATSGAIANVDTMKDNVNGIEDLLNGIDDMYRDDLAATEKHFLNDLDASQDLSDKDIEDTLKEINDELKRVQNDLDKNVKAAIADAVEATEALAVRNAAQVEQLDAYELCAETFQLYDADNNKCKDADVPQEKFMNRVSYRTFGNEDGRDGGYVDNRYLKFTKVIDESWVRVFYQDNIRLHGHDTHGAWNIMFCDDGGNGCGKCNDPANLKHAKRHIQQHGWWTNDYVGGGISGICKSSESGQLKAGKYMLKIMIDWNRYDLSTGSNGGGNFMVDEVMKY